jgi:CBS domain-containing protein
MKTVAEILLSKGNQTVHSVRPDTSVYEAIRLMSERGIGAVLVMEQDRIAGIMTERDYARKVILMDRSSKSTPVRDIMSPSVICVSPSDTNEACMALMTERRLRHLPVLDDGRLVGMISIGDLVKDIMSEQKFIIEQLELYISGTQG